jgi:hypothetical protein
MSTIVRLASLGLFIPLLLGAGPGARVVVKGQGDALGETPILVAIRVPLEPGRYLLTRSGETKAKPVVASVFRDGQTTYLSAVLDQVPAAGTLDYRLVPADPSDTSTAGISLVPEDKDVSIQLDGAPFTTYRASTGPKPIFFPLIGPTGKRFTRAFPMEEIAAEKRDHPHQRSMWFTHGKVNGIDFWAELKGHGSIAEKSRQLIPGAPSVGLIRTTDDWLGPDGKLVCTDERVVRFYGARAARILDFDITIKATNGPVTFGETKEGMFGVRVPTSMDVTSKKGGKITNSSGLTDEAAWGKPATWVDYIGPVEGETVGIAILNHPNSFRHPTTWHVRPYGLFAANPFGGHDFGMKESGDYTIPAGESIRFGYRLILHKGDTASANLPAAYSAYAKPPTVDVTSE